MSNNYWNQQNGNHGHEENDKRSPQGTYNSDVNRTSNLLQDRFYQQQHQERQQFVQSPRPAPQQSHSYSTIPQQPPEYSPLPPQYSPEPPNPPGRVPQSQPPQQQGWPNAQSWPSPSLFGSAMQLMRRWSGKIVAAPEQVIQEPLVLYRPGKTPLPQHPQRWKRSRALRISMQMRHRRKRWQLTRPNARKIWSKVIIAFSLMLVLAIGAGTVSAYAYYESQLPALQGLANRQIDQTTRIYDRNGQLLFEAYDNNEGRRTPVDYKYIPGVMQDAMVAAEDHTFWDNSGIDTQGILRAATEYIQTDAVQSGGSTITQQLIKNLTGNTQVSLNRKISEAALAIGLTQQYPKWKILEMYFNVSSFGAQELGVEAAVEDFFGLQPKCDPNFNCIPALAYLAYNPKTHKSDPILALARASLLAGMPQDPVSYDPTLGKTNLQLALQRQDIVLNQMLGLGMQINLGLGDQVDDVGPITQEMITQAETLTAKMTFTGYRFHITAPHFVYWVINQLEIALGNGDEQQGVHLFLTGGFNIRTTIDANLETYVENAVQRHLDDQEYQLFTGGYGPLNTVNNVNDAAVVVMDAKTGEVLAMDGSSDWNSTDPTINGQFNAAISPRQPGSSFKPIVYAAAFEKGWYPGIVLPDVETFFPISTAPVTNAQANYHPTDYGGSYHGWRAPIRQAIADSLNIPAIKTLEFAGSDSVYNMARRLGITSINKNLIGPSFALGTIEVPLLQMVGAYQVFADQGTRIPPQGILDIWDNYGHHIYHYDPNHPQGVQVISPQIAYLMTSILSDEPARAAEFGNIHTLSFYDWQQADGQIHQVAAKTGTTDNFKDNWTIGYTPDVVVGVWAGNADDEPFKGNVIGITGAAPIWHSVIERAMGRCNFATDQVPCGNYQSPFTQRLFIIPPGVHQQSVSSYNGLAGSGIYDWMLDGEDPQQSGLTTGTGNSTGSNGTPTPTPTASP